jgi:hypothetical protein
MRQGTDNNTSNIPSDENGIVVGVSGGVEGVSASVSRQTLFGTTDG